MTGPYLREVSTVRNRIWNRPAQRKRRRGGVISILGMAGIRLFPGFYADRKTVLLGRKRTSCKRVIRTRRIFGHVEVQNHLAPHRSRHIQEPRSRIGFLFAGQVAKDEPELLVAGISKRF